MTNSDEISKNFKLVNEGPLDAFEGPYDTVELACAAVPSVVRRGKVVAIGTTTLVDYIWHPNDITDNGLVRKTSKGRFGIEDSTTDQSRAMVLGDNTLEVTAQNAAGSLSEIFMSPVESRVTGFGSDGSYGKLDVTSGEAKLETSDSSGVKTKLFVRPGRAMVEKAGVGKDLATSFNGVEAGSNGNIIALQNVDNTSDADKPVSTAQALALAGKEPANVNIQSHIASTANPHGVTKSQVGLSNADNTSDLAKPISTATQAAITNNTNALALKADLNQLTNNQAQGAWNASTNTPTLSATPLTVGKYYEVSVAGTSSVPTGGSIAYNVGDKLISNGTVWQYIPFVGTKIPAWSAIAWPLNAQVNYLGKDWVSNAATLSTDVPGTSPIWLERLSAYGDGISGVKSALQSLTFATYFIPSFVAFPFSGGTVSVDSSGLVVARSTPDSSKYFTAVTTQEVDSYYINSVPQWVVVGITPTESIIVSVISANFNLVFGVSSAGAINGKTGFGASTAVPSGYKLRVDYTSTSISIYSSPDGTTYTLHKTFLKSVYGITANKPGVINQSTILNDITVKAILKGSIPAGINTDSIPATAVTTNDTYLAIIDPAAEKGITKVKKSDLLSADNTLTFAVERSPVYALANNPSNNYTFTYDSVTKLLQVRPISTTLTPGVYVAALNDADLKNAYIDWTGLTKQWFVIGAGANGTAYMVDPRTNPAQAYRVNANGGLTALGPFTTAINAVMPGTKCKVEHLAGFINIYSFNGLTYDLWCSITRPAEITLWRAGAVSGGQGTAANSFDVKLTLEHKLVTGKVIDTASVIASTVIQSDTDYLSIFTDSTPSKLLKIKLADFISQSLTTTKLKGRRVVLYGDSLSADYASYATYLKTKLGADLVQLRGYSGTTVSQQAEQAKLDSVIAYDPDLIICLFGGNDNGASGTIGTFAANNPNGETVVSTPDITVPYAGTKYIEAVSYIARYLKSKIYDFRPTTASYVNTSHPYDSQRKRRIVFLNGLPQNRVDATYSDPLNHQRKVSAVEEVCNRFHIPMIDVFKQMGLEMSLEPSWSGPTDQINSKGVYTMDGLHLNDYGYDRLTDIITGHLRFMI